MSAKIRIIWDGGTPGLEQGRLSLTQFGKALQALLRAARNIARRQQAAARGHEHDPSVATKGALVDLQLTSFNSGSADQTYEVVGASRGSSAIPLMDDAACEQVSRELMSSIRDESQGRRRDKFVADYLRCLPKGLNVQKYILSVNGEDVETIELGEISVPVLEPPPPALVHLRGQVEGVMFGERLSRPEVKFAPYQGKAVTFVATREQVAAAIGVKSGAQVLVIMGTSPRLLWIRPDDGTTPLLPAEKRTDHFLTHWAGALEVLAS